MEQSTADTKPAHEKVTGLVEELTTTGLEQLDKQNVHMLLALCKSNQQIIPEAYSAIMRMLSKRHAQVRLSALQLIDELFMRSHQFRLLLIRDLPRLLELTLGAYQATLPRPENDAKNLKILAARCLYTWAKKFGIAYRRLRYSYRYAKYNLRVDFSKVADKSKKELAAEKRRKLEHEENIAEYKRRLLSAIHMDVARCSPGILESLMVLDECFEILVPSMDGMFDYHESRDPDKDLSAPRTSSDGLDNSNGAEDAENEKGQIEDEDEEDINQVLAIMSSNRHAMEIEINPDQMVEVEECAENAIIYQTIREHLRLVLAIYTPQVNAWIERLDRAKDICSDSDDKSVLDNVNMLKKRMLEAVQKSRDLRIDTSQLLTSLTSNKNESDSEDNLFEDVPVLDRRILKMTQGIPPKTSGPKPHPIFDMHNAKVLKEDPTYVDPRVFETRGKHVSRTSSSSTTGVMSKTDEELYKTAPIVEFGQDLMYWDKNEVDANTTGLEIRHRFLGSARDDAKLTGSAVERLKKRAVYYSDIVDEQQKEIKACRTPMKNGKLCQRRDLKACPYHGPIIPRDELGRPQGKGFEANDNDTQQQSQEQLAETGTSNNFSTVNDTAAQDRTNAVAVAESVNSLKWQDLETLVERKHGYVRHGNKRVKGRKTDNKRASALVDVRKKKESSYSRLKKIVRK